MFTYSELTQILQESRWPEPVKQQLIPVLPRLGKWSLAYLSQQINSTGSEFSAKEIAQIVAAQPAWYEAIQKNQTEKIYSAANLVISTEDEVQHKALLSVILDIRSNKSVAAKISPDLSALFDKVEVLYLQNLPVREVADILNRRIDSIIESADLQLEVKRYCYYRDSLKKDDAEIIEFKKALESNEQVIGSEGKTVKGWLNDFLQAAASSSQRSMYNVVQYLTGSQSVKNLSEQEKEAVSEILRLYQWFFNPYVAEDEIEAYEKNRFNTEPVEAPVKPAKSELDLPRVQSKPFDDEPTASPSADTSRPTPAATLPDNKYVKPEIKIPDQYAANPGKIHDLINKKPAPRVGVVMDPTNVKLEEEKQRFEQEKKHAEDSIQSKLAELRNRNQNQQ